jgi:hypothetical protein
MTVKYGLKTTLMEKVQLLRSHCQSTNRTMHSSNPVIVAKRIASSSLNYYYY